MTDSGVEWERPSGSGGTLPKGLTRSLDCTEEGLMPNDTHVLCTPWTGAENRYQSEAAIALAVEGREPPPWAWIIPTCTTSDCLTVDHLRVQAPIRLAYPWGVCIYCGRSAWTKDHLLPRAWSGDVKRHWVAIVPACGTCNSLLSDTLTWSITERRLICHERIRKHYRKVLRTVDHTPESLDEMGRILRQHCEDAMARKAEVRRMLTWPEDAAYDARALGHSGIDNGWVTGLLLAEDDELHAHVKAVA